MRYKIFFTLFVLILLTPSAEAQVKTTVRKKDFKKEKLGFREAWKHIRNGDKYFDMKGVWYGMAYDEYLKAVAYNSENPELNYKTGAAALFSDKKDEAAGFLVKSNVEGRKIPGDLLLLTGRALQYAGKYEEALDTYNSFLSEKGKKKKEVIAATKRYIDESRSAIKLTADTLLLEVVNAGSVINSAADEYSELLSPDGKSMWFASRRQLAKSSTLYDDGKYDENIYFSSSASGSWSIPATLAKSVTTELCEAPLYITPAGDQLYFYSGSDNGGDVKVIENRKGKWRSPSSIKFRINTGGAETSFTFAPSGNEIWFVTDKGKKGKGGRDIYYIQKAGEKKWSKPVNAGDSINTIYNEESVRFSDRGDTLWFSSNGHNSIGGYDIFRSVKRPDGAWSKAVNAGYPLNTPWNELYYQPVKGDDSTFYFVSDRSGGTGGLDIYRGKYLPPEPVAVPVIETPAKPDTIVVRDTVVVVKEVTPPPQPVIPVAEPAPAPVPVKEVVIYLIGTVSDSETREGVLAKIDLIDLSNDQVVTTTASSDVDGSYRIRLPERKPYMVDLRATGYLSDMKRVNVAAGDTTSVYKMNVNLIKVKVGKKVVLNNILFETGKSVITAGSYPELNRLVGILQDSPTMRVEISGHTDNTGSLQINTTLSESRAKAVVEYLVKKGIDRARLEYKGYGPQQPIADNTTPAGRTQNRRVEFKILEF